MDLNYLSIVVGVLSVSIALYQAVKLREIKYNEIYSLFSQYERFGSLQHYLGSIITNNKFKNTRKLTINQFIEVQQIYKGISDERARIIELINRKIPDLTVDDINLWDEYGFFRSIRLTEWEKQKFVNLVIWKRRIKKRRLRMLFSPSNLCSCESQRTKRGNTNT